MCAAVSVSAGVDASVSELRGSVAGAVLTPDDIAYERARVCFNALIDRRPAVIVRCLRPADVAAAFDFARSQGLEVAVRGGGHNPAGHCVCDGGLVIDLTLMNDVEVDGEGRIARSEGGATWLDFDAATQRHGLVTPGGVVGTTGVAGLTFGGGLGHLTAQHGLTCDHLVGAEVVTPAGEVVWAGAEGDEELLWGLRGGGGNFGVATRLEFRLHPLERVVGGKVVIAGAEGVREALQRFRDIGASSPADLSCGALLGVTEGMQPFVLISPCYTGEGGLPAAVEGFLELPGVLLDGLRRHSFIEQQHVFSPTYGIDRAYWKGHFVREFPDELIDALLERLGVLGRPPGQILLESLHGAREVDAGTAAVGFREAGFNISAMGDWSDPAVDDDHIGWARATAAALEPWSLRGGGYVNYMQADEPIERVRAAFGDETFARLQALKTRYDPDNTLRRNQNIPPA